MAYKRRNVRKIASKSKRNLVVTLVLVLIIIYATISWIFPWFVEGIGSIKNLINPPKTISNNIEDSSLAPPVLNIPYESTNSSIINILGYATYGTAVKLYVDEQLQDTVDTKDDGTFIIEGVNLAIGINNIYGKTSDGEKTSLPSKNIRIIYDNEKPTLEVSEPEDGKTIQGDRKIKITGKTEPEVKVFINSNQVIVDKEGNFAKDFELNDGENNFEIKAVDQASNSTEISRKVNFIP